MKIAYLTATVLMLLATGAFAQKQEEIEPYLVAPYTLDKVVTVSMADGKKVEGKVFRGDDQKISVQQTGGPVELPTNQIESIHLRRPRKSAKVEFVGSLLGGVGFGFLGAAIGRQAGEAIRSDGNPGEVGPVLGGVVFAFGGSFAGRRIARHLNSEDVTLKIVGRQLGQTPPPVGSKPLSPLAQDADLRLANSPR